MLNRKCNFTLFFALYFLAALLGILSLSGCSSNIPLASTAVSGQVTLKWEEASDAITYNVYGSTSPGVTKFSGVKIGNAKNPITIKRLKPGKTYYFVVTVVSEQGESEKSKELSYTAVADETGLLDFEKIIQRPVAKTAPGKPVKDYVTLTWKTVQNASSYNIYYSISPGVTKLNGQKIFNVKSPHRIKGLKSGTTYYFVVTAVNNSGESEVSKETSYTVD